MPVVDLPKETICSSLRDYTWPFTVRRHRRHFPFH